MHSATMHKYNIKQECAAVEGPPSMGPSLQLSMCVCKGTVFVNRSYYIRESTNHRLEILIIRLTLTQLLCPVTLTFDPLTSKLVHGVLVSQGPFLPSLVFVGLFVLPLGGGTEQTDRRTDGRTDGQTDSIDT